MAADLRKAMKLNRRNSLLKSGRMEESLAEHRAIMQALAARDADATAQRMCKLQEWAGDGGLSLPNG